MPPLSPSQHLAPASTQSFSRHPHLELQPRLSFEQVLPRASVAWARPAGVREISSVDELRAVLRSRLPAAQPLYTRLDWWCDA